MTTETPPDALKLAPLKIEMVRNALVVPPVDQRRLPAGVFREDGSFCQHGRTVMLRQRVSAVPEYPAATDIQHLPGRYLFAGQTRPHFGHFLMEGMTRFWALGRDIGPVDGVLFFSMPGRNIQGRLKKSYGNIVHPLGQVGRLLAPVDPVRVDELVLPSQGFGHQAWIEGHEEARQFMRHRYQAAFSPEGPEKLYISRSKINTASGKFDKEYLIEEMMAHAGYDIFHPQDHPLAIQASRYLAARKIVGGDGSAFHFLAMLAYPETRIGIILRRHNPPVTDALLTHVETWTGAHVVGLDALITRPQPTRDTTAEMDVSALRRKLQKNGFL